MRKQNGLGVLTSLVTLAIAVLCPRPLSAQDVAITNARIVAGNGSVISSGTVIVRAGRIVSVSAGAATQGLKTIDAKGMTAMPGFIDAHRHINTGPNEKAQMQALLEAGYTTILSGRWSGRRKHHAARPHREGRDQRPARHSVGKDRAAGQHA